MKLNFDSTYKRVANTLYCDDIAIYRFKQNFIDLQDLTEMQIKYMEDYINENPTLCEVVPGWLVIDDVGDREFNLQENCEKIDKWINQIHETESVSIGEETVHIPIYSLDESDTHDPNDSRVDQVKFWFNKGLSSASEIAKKIEANPSYVQRLLKQVKDEAAKT